MAQQELIALVKQTAASHQLFEHIICAICEKESSYFSMFDSIAGFAPTMGKPIFANIGIGVFRSIRMSIYAGSLLRISVSPSLFSIAGVV